MLHAAIALLQDMGIYQAIQAVIAVVFLWLAYDKFVNKV
jgi:hypothetical protein